MRFHISFTAAECQIQFYADEMTYDAVRSADVALFLDPRQDVIDKKFATRQSTPKTWPNCVHRVHSSNSLTPTTMATGKKKRKEEYIYSAIYSTQSLKALRHGSHSFTCKLHHVCISFVSVHQMAPTLR